MQRSRIRLLISIYSSLFPAVLFKLFPYISDCSFCEHTCSFLVNMATFLRLKLLRGTVIAAKIGQGMVNMKLWLTESSSSHRQLHGSRRSNYRSLVCQSHTLLFVYHATGVLVEAKHIALLVSIMLLC